MSWSAVSGAAHYKVRIAGDENGLAGAAEQQTASSSYSPSEALTNGQTHYWQVRAVDGDGQSGAWSGIYSLTVNWGGISGMTPADGTAVSVYSPVLQWNPVDDAARYELQFADSQEKLTTVSAQETRDASWTAASLTNNQTYYWRVRALEAGGQTGPWSTGVSFTVQWGTITRMAPADGTETKDSPPTFSWSDVDAAVRYELQIADSKADLASTAPIEVSTPPTLPLPWRRINSTTGGYGRRGAADRTVHGVLPPLWLWTNREAMRTGRCS